MDVRTYRQDEISPITELVELIEKIVQHRQLNKYFHREEIDTIFFGILDGKDKVNVYERRDFGIDDYVWQEKIKNALYFLNLRKSYEKIYKK